MERAFYIWLFYKKPIDLQIISIVFNSKIYIALNLVEV